MNAGELRQHLVLTKLQFLSLFPGKLEQVLGGVSWSGRLEASLLSFVLLCAACARDAKKRAASRRPFPD
jgi:hypothetical protein